MGAAPFVVSLESVCRADVPLAGGKGANLGELIRAGIPVPPGYVVTTAAYEAYIAEAGCDATVRAALEAPEPTRAGALLEEARKAFEAHARPACFGAIADAYEQLGGGPVAVRSSATVEDAEDASFAGQQATFLNVEGVDGVLAAVRACWASLFQPQAAAYRVARSGDACAAAMAVVVQRMVLSERSGVAFGCDPVTHRPDVVVIEAVRGLGEALVSGAVTPDSYAVDKATLTVRDRTHAQQERQLVRGSSSGDALHANEWRELSAVLRRRPKLTDEEIARLAAIMQRVEAHYGAPQDVEWAEAGGEFFIVQARPITTMVPAG